MTTSSCKAKGRRFQQEVRDALLKAGAPHGLVEGDVRSTSMGVSGVDVQLSPLATKILGPISVECKNCESLNVTTVFANHAAKYPGTMPLLFHKRNRTEPMTTLSMKDFFTLYTEFLLRGRN